jgi:hypothetical protein
MWLAREAQSSTFKGEEPLTTAHCTQLGVQVCMLLLLVGARKRLLGALDNARSRAAAVLRQELAHPRCSPLTAGAWPGAATGTPRPAALPMPGPACSKAQEGQWQEAGCNTRVRGGIHTQGASVM